MYTNSTLSCHWCGVSLSGASQVTYLNGNLPCCGLCIMKAGGHNYTAPRYDDVYREGMLQRDKDLFKG